MAPRQVSTFEFSPSSPLYCPFDPLAQKPENLTRAPETSDGVKIISTGRTRQPNETGLNGISDWVLGKIADVGGFFNTHLDDSDIMQTTLSAPGSIAQTQRSLEIKDLQRMARNLSVNGTTWELESVARHYRSRFRVSGLVRNVAKLGGVVDSATGLVGIAQAVKKDRDIGDRNYTNTAKSAFTSTLQVASATATAVAVGGLVSSIGAPIAVPVMVGAAAGMAIGYGVKKMVDWIS